MKKHVFLKVLAAISLLTVGWNSLATAQRPVPGRPPGAPVAPAPPVVPGAPAVVRVTASALNVRTGPGPQFPVVARVGRGTTLSVRGSRAGWLNVVGPRGRTGWVYAAHTVRVR